MKLNTTLVTLGLGLVLVLGSLQAIQVFNVDGSTVTCKTGTQARSVGDFPINHPLQFQYTTQDGYSCLIVQLEPTENKQNPARVAILDLKERSGSKTPNDHGVQGNWEFLYSSRPNGKIIYGFIDYGNNTALKNFFETIKLPRHSIQESEKEQLKTKTPATFHDLQKHGAQVSK